MWPKSDEVLKSKLLRNPNCYKDWSGAEVVIPSEKAPGKITQKTPKKKLCKQNAQILQISQEAAK